MTVLIRQRHQKDCMLCCIAMAAGANYDEALRLWGDEFVASVAVHGLYGQERICKAFSALGLEMNRDYISVLGVVGGYKEYGSAPRLKSLVWGRRALVQVKSKNFDGESHMTYWNGSELFDPSPLKTYEWDEVEPEHMWLFKEV